MDGLVGAKISLTSKSDIRYRGTLHSIDQAASTISLENVVSMGTEDRRPEQPIPGTDTVYEFVVFRAADVKDLHIEQPPPPKSQPTMLPHDPAIMSVGQNAPMPPPPVQQQPLPPQSLPPSHLPQPPLQPQQPPLLPQQQPPQQQQQQQQHPLPQRPAQHPSQQPQVNLPHQAQPQRPQMPSTSRGPSEANFSSTMQRVEQAIGELSGTHRRGGHHGPSRRDHPGELSAKGPPVPSEAFDFAEMNKKFEELRREMDGEVKAKAVMHSSVKPSNGDGKPKATMVAEEDDSSDEEDEEAAGGHAVTSPGESVAYNKQKSFFDSVSSDVNVPAGQQGGGGRGRGRGRGGMSGGGGGYRWRREDEAAANLTTFGEVGGHGHRGRGGMRRGRGRGGAHGGPRQQQHPQQQQIQQ